LVPAGLAEVAEKKEEVEAVTCFRFLQELSLESYRWVFPDFLIPEAVDQVVDQLIKTVLAMVELAAPAS